MTGWLMLLSGWGCFMLGFATAALMSAARSPEDDIERAGRND